MHQCTYNLVIDFNFILEIVMLKALRFEILRGIKASGREFVRLAEKPIRVATLINEAAFEEDHYLIHHKTVFLEDRTHDWDWREGKFFYYTRIAEAADVLIVYEEASVTPPAKFDHMTGKPLVGAGKSITRP